MADWASSTAVASRINSGASRPVSVAAPSSASAAAACRTCERMGEAGDPGRRHLLHPRQQEFGLVVEQFQHLGLQGEVTARDAGQMVEVDGKPIASCRGPITGFGRRHHGSYGISNFAHMRLRSRLTPGDTATPLAKNR
jgi:hypothetical protein